MQQFQIKFADDRHDQPAALSVHAESLSDVLVFVAEHTARKPVELWRDKQLLGRLELIDGDDGSFWHVR